MIDNIDDLDLEDEDEDKTISQPIKKKTPAVSHRQEDLPQGTADCYWCGRVKQINTMQRNKINNSIVYVCQDCI